MWCTALSLDDEHPRPPPSDWLRPLLVWSGALALGLTERVPGVYALGAIVVVGVPAAANAVLSLLPGRRGV